MTKACTGLLSFPPSCYTSLTALEEREVEGKRGPWDDLHSLGEGAWKGSPRTVFGHFCLLHLENGGRSGVGPLRAAGRLP